MMRKYPDQFSWPRIELPPCFLDILFIRESKNKQTKNEKEVQHGVSYQTGELEELPQIPGLDTLRLSHCSISNE